MLYNSFETFLDKIKNGKLLKGCCITFTDPSVTEMAAESGFDFCWIDGEHGTMDRKDAMLHMMALKGTGCAPLYRVPACDHTEIKRIIDFAPAGIIIPMIRTREDAERAVDFCRYPPKGTRGFGIRRGWRYGSIPFDEYLKQSEKEPLIILQIEHIDAYRNLDSILSVPGVDSFMIGPYDFSCTAGCPGQFDDPELNKMFDDICRKTLETGKLLGVYAENHFDRWIARGVQYISCINDTSAMMIGFREMQQRILESEKKQKK